MDNKVELDWLNVVTLQRGEARTQTVYKYIYVGFTGCKKIQKVVFYAAAAAKR